MNRDSSLDTLKGIGDKTKKLFEKIQISTINDLLYYFPSDYEMLHNPQNISDAVPGEKVAILANICTSPQVKKIRNLTITTFFIKDATATMQVTFFNMPFLKNIFRQGSTFIFYGRIQTKGPAKIMEQPKYYVPEEYYKLVNVLQPKYSLTKGLTNQAIQKAVKQALSLCDLEEEFYSDNILNNYSLISREEAFHQIHFPENQEQYLKARQRFVFDEFFSFLLLLQKNKELGSKIENQYQMFETADTVRFLEQLPFPLTKGQKKVWQEIKDDCNSAYCMNRLIQGDVGSGKTIVAVLALLMCAANGFQGAMMAPTEVLAMQHYDTVTQYIKQYNLAFRPVLLVGSMTAKEKKEVYAKIASGEANLIIGTHAVIQEKVVFSSLALVVTDEQHRFGVRQREQLALKGKQPHVLVMSATPIPRTLAIILYGDLHISVIDELPANRLPIKNCVVNTAYRPKAYSFIENQITQGRQAYVICPKVEPDESSDLENVIDYTQKLKSQLSPSIQISYLHGKMRPSEKNRIMEEFANGNIDVLVSTTVIEVGINVPNATVMMVENAERFGLAQLHQLRGRVGRGNEQSYCIFLSTNEKKETMERLQILNQSNDGFYISSQDLKLRGPGDLFGVRQSGEFAFQLADIYTDASLLKDASDAVAKIMESDPTLALPEHQKMKAYFSSNHKETVDFRSI